MKKMIACLLTLALALTAVCALAEGSLTFSWRGGDARHEATQQAVDAEIRMSLACVDDHKIIAHVIEAKVYLLNGRRVDVGKIDGYDSPYGAG